MRSHRRPAHIGEAFLAQPDGDPEGSPRDPVTTDPKGEVVSHEADDNTPALVEAQGAYGVAAPLDPWYVSGLTEGEGCFCISFREAVQAQAWARGQTVILAFAERARC